MVIWWKLRNPTCCYNVFSEKSSPKIAGNCLLRTKKTRCYPNQNYNFIAKGPVQNKNKRNRKNKNDIALFDAEFHMLSNNIRTIFFLVFTSKTNFERVGILNIKGLWNSASVCYFFPFILFLFLGQALVFLIHVFGVADMCNLGRFI